MLLVGGVLAQGVYANSFYDSFKQLPKQGAKKISRKKTQPVRKWHNDLRSLFQRNAANIMAINIRTFVTFDTNKNGIIEKDEGEKSGTFSTALMGLEELSRTGVNTIHLLPITPVGKIKALGTAGSLYAMNGFSEINPQLIDEKLSISAIEQAKFFIDECHRKNIRVIVDLPSCGAYDFYLSHPHLFEKDSSGQPVIPADWTDVRLFKVKNSDGRLNEELYKLHKDLVDMVLEIGADGIRADVATIKPYEFWERLISYTRSKDPQFLYLAEASDSWTSAPSKYAVFTTYEKLLEAGFDGYYGSYFKFKDTKSDSEFASIVNHNIELSKKYSNKKSVIGSFMTHDEQSPIELGGVPYAKQLIWLNAVLPVNSYIVDGINTGDRYAYSYANRPARESWTDDYSYFVHSGKLDIFNFSRTPGGKNVELVQDYAIASVIKKSALSFINSADFKTLKSNNDNVFAYSRTDGKDSLLIILNKNMHAAENAKIKVKKINNETSIVPIKIDSFPEIKKSAIETSLQPSEIQILYIPGLVL